MKKIRISKEQLEGKSLMVATPMYGGQCCGGYVHAMLDLNTILVTRGFNLSYFSMANESLITRARNYCAREFLLGTCTHLLFIDADIEFSAHDAISLLALADENSDKDVLCGLYPKKSIHWDKVAAAAKLGVHDEEELARSGSYLAFNPIGKDVEFDDYELIEVNNCGAGFMMVQRRVFDRLIEAHPDRFYISDGIDANDKAKGNIRSFFETEINQHGVYLSEDYYFCNSVRKLGMKIWAAPWVQLHHLGFFKFKGNLQTLSVPAQHAASAA